ncbi:MAG: phosphopantothenate/pantothenate synthetase [Methanomicrobiales archaeon]|nr:phosphopantothenate/pantothenate synthetase [Methanomicrobiales archaeon]
MSIPVDHPRYHSLRVRERLAQAMQAGVVAPEGLCAHGRGESFYYLLGEQTIPSAQEAARCAAALFFVAKHPMISVNGNTAVLAASEIASLQKVTGAMVEVGLFHRTEERILMITDLLTAAGVQVLKGEAERLLPLSHDRAFCLRHGIYEADLVLVPLEDGDRAGALALLGKKVITIDLNPLSRTSRTATLPIIAEVTEVLPLITSYATSLTQSEAISILDTMPDPVWFLQAALDTISQRLSHVLD